VNEAVGLFEKVSLIKYCICMDKFELEYLIPVPELLNTGLLRIGKY